MSTDLKSVPYEDYKKILTEKADAEARNERLVQDKRNLQAENSRLKKNSAVESEPKNDESPKAAPDSMVLQLQKEIGELKGELEREKTQKLQVSTPQNAQSAGIAPEVKKSHEDHSLKIHQAACTTCGQKNPKFKPEMKCKNCRSTVGSFEAVKEMEYCPHCGEKLTALPITEEATQKVLEYLKTPKVEVASTNV